MAILSLFVYSKKLNLFGAGWYYQSIIYVNLLYYFGPEFPVFLGLFVVQRAIQSIFQFPQPISINFD